jgi:hypothetical protein
MRREQDSRRPTLSSQAVRTHQRYASGCVIHQAEFSSIFAAAYYTPGVLDLMKTMCQSPKDHFSSIVWKISVTPGAQFACFTSTKVQTY